LKKLDQSIEVAHSNVQRLIVSQFDSVMQSLNFHLAELLGHIRAAEDNFSLWGIKVIYFCDTIYDFFYLLPQRLN